MSNGRESYEVTTTPVWGPSPANLTFKIRILNGKNDVIRLSGVLARFNLAGKEYALDAESSGLKPLIEGVLAPKEQKEFELVVASATRLHDGDNLSLRVFGVPTGSANEKGNFEWTWRVKIAQETRPAQVRIETVAMTAEEVYDAERRQADEIAAAEGSTIEAKAKGKSAADALARCRTRCDEESAKCAAGLTPKQQGFCPPVDNCYFVCSQNSHTFKD